VVQDKEKIVNELSTLFLNFLKVTVLKDFNQQREIAETLLNKAYQVPLDEISNRYRKRIGLELLYNKFQPFHWAAYLFILLGFCFLLPNFKKYQNPFLYFGALFLPFTLMVYGFITRILITGFSPVTNMYGTMLWLSFGMTIFNFVLLFLYKNYNLTAILSIIIGVVLLVTHQAPLVLSPDMDPIVAVLRNNFWLATHVLTVTISYAAFSLAMLISNYAMILKIAGKLNDQTMKTYSHYAYRMIQLGVFLLTLGIILGGVWADYSWGRFWGWDPKETWALIADLGFLIILHARFVGWVKDDTLLFWTPIAYLLVIMAWYGVNFILATGLHSYGFSSGGVSFVVGFVLAQILINLATFLIHKNSNAA
jgi:ABC-type transport system involved in cytochrome c biogenesis permease subunit